MSVLEIGVVNPRKRRGRKKANRNRRTTPAASPRRRTRPAISNPVRRRRRAAPKRAIARRRRAATGTRLNPIETDLIKTAKDVGIMTGGAIMAYVAADYAARSIDYVAENQKIAKPAIMAATGVATVGMLKGRNKPLGTKLAYGMFVAGALYAIMPWLVDKIPGLPTMEATTGPIAPPSIDNMAGYYRAGALGTYLPQPPGAPDVRKGLGAYGYGDAYPSGLAAYYAEEMGNDYSPMGVIEVGGHYGYQ